jgi:cystathionine gamma-synthase
LSRELRAATLAIHADHGVESTPDVAPPIHVATTYEAGNAEGLIYGRYGHATHARLEAVLGALEGGEAVAFATGQAATTAALSVLKPRRVVMGEGGYFGTHAAITRLGLTEAPLDATLGAGDLVWLETPKNPTGECADIAAYVHRAHAAGARLVVDSTLASPALQRPLALGADVVMHSTTKLVAGHSDALGGVLVARDAALAQALRSDRSVAGAVPGALEAWLTLRGVRTLALRVLHQSASATRLAAHLDGHVARVWHPSLPSHPSFEIARRQMRAPGSILALELDSEAQAVALPSKLSLFTDATSLGSVESLIEWRRKHDAHSPPTLLRVSVGVEDADDLVADLEQGLRAVGAWHA